MTGRRLNRSVGIIASYFTKQFVWKNWNSGEVSSSPTRLHITVQSWVFT